MENNILYICITVVVLAVVIFVGISFLRAEKITFIEEILHTQDWSTDKGRVYRRDFTIKRVYSNGKEEIYMKQINT